MPFFSIVIPAYNRAELLNPTLRTILEQGFSDYEVIIVDDGSTDNMKEVVGAFSADHKNIHYIHQQNSERGRARNTGIGHATGTYVVMFDSDDFMHPDHLQSLYEAILALHEPDFIATKFDFTTHGKSRKSDNMKLSPGYYDYRLLLRGNSLACNVCFRRNLPSLMLFEEDRRYAMMEDWMFLIQNLKNSKVYLVDKVTISMNDHERRSMKLDHAALIKKAGLAYEWILKHVPLSDSERRILKAQIHFLSAIHYYLDNNRKGVINQLLQATSTNGFMFRYAVLFLKCLPGHVFLSKIKPD